MKIKVKKLEGTARELDIEVSKEAVENVYNEVIEDIKKTAQIPGFRAGKAPLDMIKKRYNNDAMEEVKRSLVPEAYQEALKEHDMDPLSYPELFDINLSLSGKMTFKARVDIHPEIDLRKYKGIKVETKKIEVSDKEIEEALKSVINIHAEFAEVDRELKKGDFGICDVETSINGEIISKKRENMWIEVDKEVSLLGIGEELCGLKPLDEKDIEADLPENYPDTKYAGKKAVFHVKVKKVKEKKLPEVNDEFAKKLGKETMKEVKDEIGTQLRDRKNANEKVGMKNQIMKQLIEKHKFDLPHSMVTRQLKVLLDRAENELIQKGVGKGEIDKHKNDLKETLRKEAENKVRVYFILNEIAKKEKIETEEEELNDWLKNLALSYNQDVESVKKYYNENDLTEGLKEQLREDKTLDFLVKEAVISVKE
ncbi:MAG: trigger factor [Candidatus Omnitrophota bacterium]